LPVDFASFYHFLDEHEEEIWQGLSRKLRRTSVALGSLQRNARPTFHVTLKTFIGKELDFKVIISRITQVGKKLHRVHIISSILPATMAVVAILFMHSLVLSSSHSYHNVIFSV
jgi:hypothetical protein